MPEMKVRRWLWSHGYRYRLNVKSVPGKPDIVLRAYRTAIFVNGCVLTFRLSSLRSIYKVFGSPYGVLAWARGGGATS